MSIKTEILENLIRDLSDISELKYVKRGDVSIEDVDFRSPLCSVSSVRQIFSPEGNTYNNLLLEMTVFIDLYNKTRTDYYPALDLIEEKILKLISEYQLCTRELHSSVLKVDFEDVREIINEEEYLEGLFHLRFVLNITYNTGG